MKKVDLTGQRFGRLLVIEKLPHYKRNNTYYRCKCNCGNEKIVSYVNLGRSINSCGCLRIETCKKKKLPDDVIRINAMRRYYKRNAKLRGSSWELTNQQFEDMVKQPCSYCGYFDPIKFSGIDRKDNTLGYTFVNSISCCRWCNWGKNERNINEFKDWVERLYERRNIFY